ncbi:acyl carrier protein [Cohnella cholangitidis]|uniref:Acyl carrier protein n=1 Tax=Cohnella cholangitidis TaxID=2598458 RepID=A0A7G5BXH3_9BACL|nr:phosphopantetheine-binding protein [Cohnella cholangitidis]QMV41657.1 acyl carrier protein [Cohnella cholangitidis]
MERLLEIVNDMFEESGRQPIDSLENSMHLRDDLNMDSLMLAELTVRIEAEYEVDIFENGIVQTIGEIISRIEGK